MTTNFATTLRRWSWIPALASLGRNDGRAQVSNPGSAPSRGSAIASTLNNSPIWSGAVRRASAASISAACCGVAFACSRAARCSIPSRRRNSPWASGPCVRCACASRATRERGEIDLGGEVRLAGIGERIGEFMRAHGLQRVAERGRGVAIVDDQRRAAVLRDAPRQQTDRARRGAAPGSRRPARPPKCRGGGSGMTDEGRAGRRRGRPCAGASRRDP